MPQTKKSSSTASKALRAFREPPALKRLSKSLEAAQDALSQLQSHAGRDVSEGVRDIYKELKTFVSSARKDTTKFAKALQKDFERLQKGVTGGGSSRSSNRTTTASRTAASRTTASRRTTTRRTTTRRTATKRATGNATTTSGSDSAADGS